MVEDMYGTVCSNYKILNTSVLFFFVMNHKKKIVARSVEDMHSVRILLAPIINSPYTRSMKVTGTEWRRGVGCGEEILKTNVDISKVVSKVNVNENIIQDL